MRRKNVSAATLASLLVVMAGGIFLASCTFRRHRQRHPLAGHHPVARFRVGSDGSGAAIYRHRCQPDQHDHYLVCK